MSYASVCDHSVHRFFLVLILLILSCSVNLYQFRAVYNEEATWRSSREKLTDEQIVLEGYKLLDVRIQQQAYDKLENQSLSSKSPLIPPLGTDIVIISAYDYQHEPPEKSIDQVLQNRVDYANQHGYIYYFVNLTDDPFKQSHRIPEWTIIPVLKQAMNTHPNAKWFWWLDVNAVIMNHEICLGPHLLNTNSMEKRLMFGQPLINADKNFQPGKLYYEHDEVNITNIDIVVAQDYAGLDPTSLFLRNSNFTRNFLDIWDGYGDSYPRQVQDSLIDMVLNDKVHQIMDHVGLMPLRLFNAIHTDPEDTKPWTYHSGDFVLRANDTILAQTLNAWKLF